MEEFRKILEDTRLYSDCEMTVTYLMNYKLENTNTTVTLNLANCANKRKAVVTNVELNHPRPEGMPDVQALYESYVQKKESKRAKPEMFGVY